MIGWIIFGSIALIIALILFLSVSLTITYENNADIKVRYAVFTIFPRAKKPVKPAKVRKEKKPKAAKPPAQAAEMPEELKASPPKEEPTEPEKSEPPKAEKPAKEKQKLDLDFIKGLLSSASPPARWMVGRIRVYNLYIDSVVGSDDAAKTALRYGSQCIAVHGFIVWLKSFLRVQVREVNIEADFDREENDLFVYCNVKLRIAAVIGCGVWFFVRYLRHSMKNSPQKPRTRTKQTT